MSETDDTRHLRLYLMRHGEVEGASDGKLFGRTDVPLSERGIAQARRLAERLEGERLSAIYSSNLRRAHLTAQMIAARHRAPAEALPAWQEIDMGEWEGSTVAELHALTPERVAALFDDPASFEYPGGESFANFIARIQEALSRLLAVNQSCEIALVAHGGVCRAIIGGVLDMPPRNWLRLAQDFGCLNIIDWYDGNPVLRLLNDSSKLGATMEETITNERPQAPLVDGEDYYYEGRFMVFTARYHLRRGYCCRSGCRHCPYGYRA